MIDYAGQLYDPVYNALGVSAQLTPVKSGQSVTITVIDKTRGIEIPISGDLEVMTVKPACVARVAELTENGIDMADLKYSAITFNGKTWRIENKRMEPSPNGESDGEVTMILIEKTDD